jgi:hypothetical protein
VREPHSLDVGRQVGGRTGSRKSADVADSQSASLPDYRQREGGDGKGEGKEDATDEGKRVVTSDPFLFADA